MTRDTADETAALNAAAPIAAEYPATTLYKNETSIGIDNTGGGRSADLET